jgi:fused signal recognition particle receptor
MFNFIASQLQKIYAHVTSKVAHLFVSKVIDHQALQDLERILIEADTGVQLTKRISAHLKTLLTTGRITQGSDLKKCLEEQLLEILQHTHYKENNTQIYVLVGINGSGKTSCAAKLAYRARSQGKKVMLVAADTFRAAATDQLEIWAQRIPCEFVKGTEGQDPSSVIFKAAQLFRQENCDTMIIDTAGRLQTKVHLMKELEKIGRTIAKQLPQYTITTLLTIDSMLGQNSFQQAKIFKESTQLNGVIVTKLDGTGKGGIVFALTDQLSLPTAYLSFGENLEDMAPFNAQNYVSQLLG